MLCDLCQKQEATVHTTHCTNVAGDVPKQSHLCDECFEASNPPEAHGLTAAFEAGCRYCGSKADSGGFDPVAMLSGARRLSFTCKPCAEEYYRFLDQKLPGFVHCATTATVTDELIAKMRTCDMSAILTELEDHMKKWVAERISK